MTIAEMESQSQGIENTKEECLVSGNGEWNPFPIQKLKAIPGKSKVD